MSDAAVYFLVLVAAVVILVDVWAVISVFRSDSHVGIKALWAIGIGLFPVVGLLLWVLFGPRAAARASG